MSDKKTGPKKAASLTGALLARKGMATPAGFVRVATDSSQAQVEGDQGAAAHGGATAQLLTLSGQAPAGQAPAGQATSGQAALDLGDRPPVNGPEGEVSTGTVADGATAKTGNGAGGPEGEWGSLSDIQIGPRFREEEPPGLPGPSMPGPPLSQPLSGSGSRALPTIGPGRPSPTVRVEPTFVARQVPPDTGEGGGLPGITSVPPAAVADREALAAAEPEAKPVPEPRGPETKLPGATPSAPPPVGDVPPVAKEPPPPRRELRERPMGRPMAPASRPRAARRRRRVMPALVSLLALLVFLFVSWAVYQVGQGEGREGADNERLWSSAEELGFAVTQLFAAVTGRIDETPERVEPESSAEPTPAVEVAEISETPETAPADRPVVDEAGPVEPADDVAIAAPSAAPPADDPVAAASEANEVAAVDGGDAAPAAIVPPQIVEITPAEGGLSTAGPVAEATPPAPVLGPTLLSPSEVAQSLPSAADVAPGGGAVAVDNQTPAAVAELPVDAEPAVEAPVAVDEGIVPEASQSDGIAAAAPRVGVPIPKPAALVRADLGGQASSGEAVAREGFAVQLSSLKDEAAARREWARLSEELADVLDETKLTVESGTAGTRGTFYRVLTTRFDARADAQAICEAIRGTGQDCLVVQQR